jgi:hypothetical protein
VDQKGDGEPSQGGVGTAALVGWSGEPSDGDAYGSRSRGGRITCNQHERDRLSSPIGVRAYSYVGDKVAILAGWASVARIEDMERSLWTDLELAQEGLSDIGFDGDLPPGGPEAVGKGTPRKHLRTRG